MNGPNVSQALNAARRALGIHGRRLDQWTAEDVAAAREVGETLLTFAAAAELLLKARGGEQP